MAFRLSMSMMMMMTTMTLSLAILSASATEFEAGGNRGWIVPPANATTNYYTGWASLMRFQVGDTLRFKYKKDSVMEVTEADYKHCNATQPISYSNTGNTIINLNRSGYFYFISGASGHCDKGQKMVVKVMAPDHHPSSSASVLPIGLLVIPLIIMPIQFLLSCF